MSQAGRLKISNQDLPPNVPLQFSTDDFTIAVPNSNNLNIFSSFTSDNNNNGIRTFALGETVTIQLTNRFSNLGSTVDDSTANLLNFSLNTFPSTYLFEFHVISREDTTGDAAGMILTATAKTDGVTSEIISTNYTDIKTSTSLEDVEIDFTASGNEVNLDVTGIIGTTISFNYVGRYVTV